MAVMGLQPDPRVVEARPGICEIETAPRYVPSGESYDGFELAQDEVSKALASAALSVRQGCAWGVPGRSPYKGSVKEALVAARLPEEVVSKIDSMVAHGVVSDRVEIRRDSIRTVNGKRHFDTKILAMGFGQTLCFATQVNFRPGHVEVADLYDATDATGTNYAVMIPYVCGNVSVLAERAERLEAEPAGNGVWVAPELDTVAVRPPGPGGGGKICRPDSALLDEPSGMRTVPEPATIAILVAALIAMVVSERIGGRRSRNRPGGE